MSADVPRGHNPSRFRRAFRPRAYRNATAVNGLPDGHVRQVPKPYGWPPDPPVTTEHARGSYGGMHPDRLDTGECLPSRLCSVAGIDIRLLTVFEAVADQGCITKASGALGIAQPAVSRSLRVLELRLGVDLVARSAQGVHLLPAGEALLPLARDVLNACDHAIDSVRAAARQA